MKGLNKVFFIGNVGQDIELKTTESGKKVVNFSLATSELYKDKNGEKVQVTDWHNITAWEALADVIAKYVKSGSRLHIEGKMKYKSYEDKEGVKRRTSFVVANTIIFLDSVKAEINDELQNATAGEPSENESDDLPF